MPHRLSEIEHLRWKLAEREREVLRLARRLADWQRPSAQSLAAEGWSNRWIAEKLGLSLAETRKLTWTP